MRPDSLPNAITEPENVIAPMNVPMKSSSLLPVGIGTCRPNAAGSWIAEIAISTAARPTSEWNAATSSGICVICTRRAMTAPIDPADRDAGEDQPDVARVRVDERQRDDDRDRHPGDAEQVAATRGGRMRQPLQREDEAHRRDQVPERDLIGAHRNAPRDRLVRALRRMGCESRASPCVRTSMLRRRLRGRFLALEHLQHSLRDQEAAEHVDRGQHDREPRRPSRPSRMPPVLPRASRRRG